MAAKTYAAPLRLEPRRSGRLAVFLAASVAGAVLCPFAVSMPPGWRIAVLAVTGAVAFRAYREHFGWKRIRRAVWDELGQWRLWLADGTEREVQLHRDSFVTPEVMILNFRAGRRQFRWVVFSDVLDPDTLRRLRVRLRLDGAEGRTEPREDLSLSSK